MVFATESLFDDFLASSAAEDNFFPKARPQVFQELARPVNAWLGVRLCFKVQC